MLSGKNQDKRKKCHVNKVTKCVLTLISASLRNENQLYRSEFWSFSKALSLLQFIFLKKILKHFLNITRYFRTLCLIWQPLSVFFPSKIQMHIPMLLILRSLDIRTRIECVWRHFGTVDDRLLISAVLSQVNYGEGGQGLAMMIDF